MAKLKLVTKNPPASPPPALPKVEPPKAELQPQARTDIKPVRIGGRRWWLVGIGVVVIVLAFVAVFLIDLRSNMVLAVIAVMAMLGGGIAVYLGIQNREERLVYVSASGGKKVEIDPLHPPNSFNIYPDKVAFEYEANPLGVPWQCEDDQHQQFYYVHLKGEQMSELRLPDNDDSERYYDPIEYGNVVTMPLNKKFFSWVPSTGKLIAMGIMAVIILIEMIGLIAIGG